MNYLFLSIKHSASKVNLSSINLPIFLALLLFGQVFLSALAYFFGVENRLFILPFRGLIALYSLYTVLINIAANRSRFLEAFPVALAVFWFIYFAKLLLDYFLLGVAIALPIWEFFAWGIGGCLLPSLACYFLAGNYERGPNLMHILRLGFLLLGSSTVLFACSVGLDYHRFMLPSLNPINASHSFFVLSLIAILCLAYRKSSVISALVSASIASFGVAMGIYAGSRGALLAFVCSFLLVFFTHMYNKWLLLVPLFFTAYLLIQFDPSDLVGRLSTVGSDMTSTVRLLAISESIRLFLANPLFGSGFGYHIDLSNFLGYSQIWYPHNSIFESLALGGLLLTLPLFVCIFLAIRSCVYSMNHPSESQLWRIAILVQAFGYVAFSGHLANVPLFWISLGLASSLAPMGIAKIKS